MIFFIPHCPKDVILSGDVCIHRSLHIVRGHVCDVRLLNQTTDLREREAWTNSVMTLLHDIGSQHSFKGSVCMLNSI